jgi:hypothetical protein
MKRIILLITMAWMLHGCEDDNKPLEQGHTGPTIDVARDVKNSPQETGTGSSQQ